MWDVMRARLPLRLARSAFFAIVCVMLAVGAHRLGGGSIPSFTTALAAGAVVLAVAAGMAGRERSASTISVLLVVAQASLHELFDRTAPAAASALPAVHAHGGLGVDLGMIIAHLTATLITGWWLARGEIALWSLLRRAGARATGSLRALLAVLSREPAPVLPRSFGFLSTVSRVRPGRVLLHAVTRRGPPRPAAPRLLVRAAGTSSA
ncbi:hypothetical protein GCM10023194_07890 [Planotetraspora phitsanulokensis]|uniref:Uncharacterized protein n=2 Tax=Planotetraspora phitsanulokensis TaxID=575192 RepID=A0A8J3XGC5_9ACTN|nr:hypothetical protein Pph01_50280 [Planotetraspora phitsanulokensis]